MHRQEKHTASLQPNRDENSFSSFSQILNFTKSWPKVLGKKQNVF